MKDNIENRIVNIMKNDMRRDYTIPEIMKASEIINREKVVTALTRLEGKNKIELREKGRTKHYRLKVTD